MLPALLTTALASSPIPGAGPAAPVLPRSALPVWAAPATPAPLPGAPAPPAWEEIPFIPDPHPVTWSYGRRYQELLAGLMGGPRASTVFGPTVAEADVHWRLVDATGRGLELDREDATRWQDTALAGSLLALERLAHETIERAPTLYGIYVAGDTLLSPSFDVLPSEEGELRVTHLPGGAAARALERAEAEQMAPGAPGLRRRPPTGVGVGLDWALREEDAPPDAPLIRYTAWLNATGFGLSSLRLELAPASLAWVASGRQILRPRLFLIGSARSAERNPTPGRLSGGLMWIPSARSACNVRAERIVDLLAPDARWMVTLRCEGRTPIPAPLDAPLGDRGRGGPTLPWAPESGPNQPTRW